MAPPGLAAAKIGLATTFVDVAIEGLEPGMTHTVSDFLELRYPLRNPAGTATEAFLSAGRPEASTVAAPWEPIPDPAWIRFHPETLRIGPRRRGASEISIVLPDDPRLFGRHFEAVVRARTLTKGPVAAGVRSRLRFSVGPAPRPGSAAGEGGSPCSLEPGDLWLRRAGAGARAVLTVKNSGAGPLELVPSAVPWTAGDGRSLPRGYRPAGDLGWVRFSPGRLQLAAGESAELETALDPPDELRGHRIVFEVKAGPCRSRRVFAEFR